MPKQDPLTQEVTSIPSLRFETPNERDTENWFQEHKEKGNSAEVALELYLIQYQGHRQPN